MLLTYLYYLSAFDCFGGAVIVYVISVHEVVAPMPGLGKKVLCMDVDGVKPRTLAST